MSLFKKMGIVPVLALCTAGLFAPQKADADINLNLFPKKPIYRSVMADPDITNSKIEFSNPGKLEQSLETPLKEIPEKIPYNLSLGESLPLISLSNEVLFPELIINGSLNFSEKNRMDYKISPELFISSPWINKKFSDGNRLYLVAGYEGEGSEELNSLTDKNLTSLLKPLIDNYSFFSDVYIVPKSPWSEQYLIFRAGLDNLFSNKKNKQANVHTSLSWEFPSFFHELGLFKNLKVSPYVSLYAQFPTDKLDASKLRGQMGIKASGESYRSLLLYGQVDYDKQSGESWDFSLGLKWDF